MVIHTIQKAISSLSPLLNIQVEYNENLRNITQAKYLRRPEGCVAKKSDTG